MQFTNPSWNAYDTYTSGNVTSVEESKPKLEKPILGTDEIGITVVTKDQMTGGNVVQNVDAAIRSGASKLQLVFSQPHTNPIGGGSKSMGKDVRESLRELARANSVTIEGVEMPTSSMTNLSGYDMQRGNISEQKRLGDLQEVKEAIKFIADVAGGGGVDIWSQEFTRNIIDADWNKKGKWANQFEAYEGEDFYSTELLVDKRTGQVMQELKHSSDIFEPVFKKAKENKMGIDVNGNSVEILKGDYIDSEGRWIDPRDREQLLQRVPDWDDQNKKFRAEKVSWNQIVEKTETFNKRFSTDYDPAEYAFRLQMENQWMQTRGSSLFHTQRYKMEIKQLDSLKKNLEYYKEIEKNATPEEIETMKKEDPHFKYSEYTQGEYMLPSEIIEQEISEKNHSLKHVHESSAAADAKAEELMITMDEGIISLKKFAKQQAIKSYSELGLEAMRETEHNKNVEKAIHVGPEIGWPTGYGGHPEEFIELITESRKEMVKKLVKEGYSEQEANAKSKEHLRGVFDTGHMSMWFGHFKKEGTETEEQRLTRFKGWYMEMVKKMQDADVIGGIQAVDSAGAGHEHLPIGQGIIGDTVVEAVDYLKGQGWNGFVVSEGHGEEQFGRGRIMLETWKAFGAEISDSYFSAPPAASWNSIQDQYHGGVNPPPYIIGNYSPSEDWTFWSGVPLE